MLTPICNDLVSRVVRRINIMFHVCGIISVTQATGFHSIFAAALISLFGCHGFAQSGASYTAQRRIDSIVVDGILNEASWVNAATSSVFMVWNGTAAPATLETSAKMIWDDQFLFIGLSAKDADIYATYSGRDVPCWEQDTFEVFVTVPGTTGYLELDGSPIGAIWDGYFTNVFQGLGGSYNLTNLQVAGHVNGTLNNSTSQDLGFTGEMRIPFSDIYQGIPGGHPTNGSQLRLNMYRINWNTPVAQGGSGAAGSDTYYAWSPVSGASVSFHRPDKFGTVTFSSAAVPSPAWSLNIQRFAMTNFVLSGVGHPGGKFWVMSASDVASPAIVWTGIATNTFDPATGQFSLTNIIAPGNTQQFYRLQSP